MSSIQIPDGGQLHPDAADGSAFNGAVGQGVANVLLAVIARQSQVKTVCDLGCGNGYLAGVLARRGCSVLGIDGSATYIDMARASNSGHGATFINALIDDDLVRQVQASHPPFDLVVSSDVIEHLYNPLAFLKAAHALVKPGGVAVIGTPYHGYWKNLAISLKGGWDQHHGVAWHGGHIKFFSVQSLSDMLYDAGFNRPSFEYFGRVPGFWKNMIAVATKPDAPRVE
jgi:SAM-dependent methyltransferase